MASGNEKKLVWTQRVAKEKKAFENKLEEYRLLVEDYVMNCHPPHQITSGEQICRASDQRV